jgi:hypothetical protein
MKQKPIGNLPPVPAGFHVRKAPSGFSVVEIDYWADPAKTPMWAEKIRKLMPSEKQFRREFLRDWDSGEGDSFYPEFQTWGGRRMFVRKAPGVLSNLPIYRGWDFGFRRPACVWFQYAPKQDLVWVLREIMPEQLPTDSFCELVQYLSGQLDIRHLNIGALNWVEKIRETPGLPKPPWFQADAVPYNFIDYAGPEALKTSATVVSDTAERTDYEVLASKGVVLSTAASSPKARSRIIRRLFHPRGNSPESGTPGILFDPACPILIRGMSGGITFPVATPQKPHPDVDEPRKDGYFEHTHDALGYGVIGVVPAVDPEQERLNTAVRTTGLIPRGRPVRLDYDEDLGFYENATDRS